MKLYLAQHGEALTKEEHTERPLSDKGRIDVGRVAWHLAMLGLEVAEVQHSGKTRARESAEILAASLGAVCGDRNGLGPNDPVAAVAEASAEWQEDRLLVGHLPFMGRLTDHLVGGGEDLDLLAFSPGCLACLEREDAGSWRIEWMLNPDDLDGSLG